MKGIYPYLAKIVQPLDLHKFSDQELLEVAKEVRESILKNVSVTGGHLSASLGTVELTVALYAAYSIPPDKVIWDTGHQAYPHKILTGRLEQFDKLRKHGGISGFLSRSEHPLDHFGAGHAGTAISAALGFAVARDQTKKNEKIVAVVGDTSICTGMSWEALNHAGELNTDLTVVLNDNRMSIAPSVGALTEYFTRLRSRPMVQSLAQRAKDVVGKLPSPVTRVAAGLRHGITHYFAPEQTGTIFEEMGFIYIGPVDGHDLPVLLEIFRNVRELKGPIFVHALTVKGKGYSVAEQDARKWHGVVPFDIEKCEMTQTAGPMTYTQTFGDAAIAAAKKDEKVVAITAAMPDGTGLTKFSQTFPDRYYDVGIAEQHAVTFAAGLAAGGLKPFCTIYSTFLQRGFDQVLHDVCIQNLPVRFFMDRGGLVGDDGPTHHGTFDISYLSLMPNMTLLAPRDTVELTEMTHFMTGYDKGPIAMRYPRGAEEGVLPKLRTPIEFGRSEVLLEGEHVVFYAVGSMVHVAWSAAKKLAGEGIKATVINARFIKPLDIQTLIPYVKRAGHLITIEENAEIGGFGHQVRDALLDLGLNTIHHQILAIPDRFIEHGAQPIIRAECGLSVENMIQFTRKMLLQERMKKSAPLLV